MPDDRGVYPIFLDKKWSLEDFYEYSRKFEQVYFATEALVPSLRHANHERIDRAFQTFPWRGGFSIVNFYERLKFATPKPLRPDIVSI